MEKEEMTAIVVIAYNRKAPLLRLLKSLNEACYPEGKDIPLIISIDKSDSDEVERAAQDFEWKHGSKEVRLKEENLGLKKHVLSCGDISEEFGSVIMLEDDLFVSKAFYFYTLAALKKSRHDERVGGISLYNHRLNVHAREPFEAADDGYDNYFIQFASSWGQAFLKEQWASFREWFEAHKNEAVEADNVPENVSSWSEKSWLKYYIKYLIDTDRFFSYPRISLTTNFGDEGTHAESSVNDLQVPLAGLKKGAVSDYRISTPDESLSVYDAYFENMCLTDFLPDDIRNDVTIDLYGTKQAGLHGRYLLTSKALPHKLLKSFGLKMRPIDANIIHDVNGFDLFLYDTKTESAAPKTNPADRYLYNYRALKAKEMMSILKYRIKGKIKK